MDDLLSHLEHIKYNYSDESAYCNRTITTIKIAWWVLKKYYCLVVNLPALNAAVAIHYNMKWM
jgi:hypothetical protein